MAKKNKTYSYSGPVMCFGNCIERNWQTTTWAPSEKRALHNLAFRYKRDHNMARNAKITLPGKIILEGE